jgi:hypothetical protein
MANPVNGLHACPTRIDGAPVLFAHKVTQGQCQDRQRGHYHKCYACVHNNALRSADGRANGHVDGAVNGHASGSANGRVNGAAHAPIAARETKLSIPKLTIRAH